jgi:hypothetical protein
VAQKPEQSIQEAAAAEKPIKLTVRAGTERRQQTKKSRKHTEDCRQP